MKVKFVITMLLFLSISAIAAENESVLRMKIEGMTCGMCEKKVQTKLAPLCKHLTIDRDKRTGVCHFVAPVTQEQILLEANKTGFKTTKLN